MLGLRLERQKGQNIEKIALSNIREEPTPISELGMYRFFLDDTHVNAEIYVGNLQLQHIKANGGSIYFLKQENQLSEFSQLFVNQIGFVTIEVWSAEALLFSRYVEIDSFKVSQTDLEIWIKTIQSVFPMANIGSDFSPMSNVKVNFSNEDGFFSFSSFSTEFFEFLSGLDTNFQKPGFLKRAFSSEDKLGSGGAIDHSKHSTWLNGRIKWKKTKFSQNSLISRNTASYEPINYPTKKVLINYNTDMNQILLERFIDAEGMIDKFLLKCQKTSVRDLDVRNIQFANKNNKLNLIEIIVRRLHLCSGLLQVFISQLKNLGVRPRSINVKYDVRFIELTNTISALDLFLKPLRQLDQVSKNYLALPSTDYLFEYYSYAVVINGFKEIGFDISDFGEGVPVPFFVRLFREHDKAQITIFFDQTIPKLGRDSYFHPLVDKNRSTSFKRPDFIIHIQKNNFDTTFIIDAKFCNLKNTMKYNFGTKLNSGHLVGKYTSGISQIGPLGAPPFFILAMCLADNTDAKTEFKSSLHDSIHVFSPMSPLFQSGALAIGYQSYDEISDFFSNAIKFHSVLFEHLHSVNTEKIEFSRPKVEAPPLMNAEVERHSERLVSSWSHSAPRIDENAAAEIKGMLSRGDKPQDIAFYFGVNNGRISEIKSEATFKDVTAKIVDLPPAGPYPSVRDFLTRSG